MNNGLLGELLTDKKPVEVESKATKARTEVAIESTQYDGGEKHTAVKEIKSEQVEVKREILVDDRPIHLSMEMGATLNLGGYNMGKVSVSIHVPVGKKITPEVQKQIDESAEYAKKHCEDRMKLEVAELLKLRGSLG